MPIGHSLNTAAFVSGFRAVLPRFSHSQLAAFDWLEAAHLRSELTRREKVDIEIEPSLEAFRKSLAVGLRRFGCAPPRISRRMTDLKDFSHQNWEEMEVFRLHECAAGAPLGVRMHAFAAAADRALCALYPDNPSSHDPTVIVEGALPSPTDPEFLIHVSCTGYLSPSPTQKLISLRGWCDSAESHQIYHMGCYASVPALRTALMALESKRYMRSDVVHTEICTLHFDPSVHHPEQLVVQSLFADGHISYVVSQEKPHPGKGFRVLNVLEAIIPDSLNHMTWTPGSNSLNMTLSRDVPQLVACHVKGFVQRLCQGAGVDPSEVLRSGTAALHPGGPRIIDGLQEVLELDDDQVAASREILHDRGNMSSATLPHILQRVLCEPSSSASGLMIGLAFGPGLTMAGVLLERV